MRVKNLTSSERWTWFARAAGCAVVFAVFVWEWMRWPSGSRLLGPIGMIWYNGADALLIVISAFTLACHLAVVIWPRWFMALISLFGVVNWLFWGAVVQGIGC